MQIRNDAVAVLTDARSIINLPAPITETLDTLERIRAERSALVEPIVPTSRASAIVGGSSAADSIVSEAEYETAAQAYREQTAAYDAAALHITETKVYQLLIEHGDDIIAGPMRDKVDKMLDFARPKVKLCARFAPAFDAQTIVDNATTAELKAWQSLIEHNRDLGVLIELWWLINGTLTSRVGFKGRYIQADHLHTEIGGGAIWANPDACVTEEARGRWQSRSARYLRRPQLARLDIWAVASQPAEAGFRLGTIPELAARFDVVRHEEAALLGHSTSSLPAPKKD